MVEIAIPLSASPSRPRLSTLGARLRTLVASPRRHEPATGPCCFGRMDAKDALVARGLAAGLVLNRAETQQ